MLSVLGLALLTAAVAVGALGIVAWLERGTAPVGTRVAGVDIGGLREPDARLTLRAAAAKRARRSIRLIAPGGEARTSGRELGAAAELQPALERAFDAGPVERLLRHVGIGEAEKIPLSYRLGPVRAATVANRIDAAFGTLPRDGDVVVAAGEVRVSPAEPGLAVDRGRLRRALRTLPPEVGVPLEEAAPVVSTDEAAKAAALIERLTSSARGVGYADGRATLFPSRLRALVRTKREDGALGVSLAPRELLVSLRPRLGRFERAPRDASFAVNGKSVSVVPARPGLALDVERIASSLVSDLRSTVHRATFEVRQPALTTAEAKSLRIKELVSEFTTYYTCCPPRVANIQRGVQIMDGTIIRPGGSFSLNDVLGKRTEERGFVSAPQIFNGRLEDAVGGGISQIATTTYNAAFFAGVQIVTHQPHEFYISRYPMGREATVSWGGPELIWRNDWPAGVLVKATATSSSITVRLYSSKLGRRVTTTMSEPTAFTSPRTIVVSNSLLAAGTTQTVQSAGPSGFLISYTRRVFRKGDLRRNERYVWRYKPENAIVEVGPPAPPRRPSPKRPVTDPEPG